MQSWCNEAQSEKRCWWTLWYSKCNFAMPVQFHAKMVFKIALRFLWLCACTKKDMCAVLIKLFSAFELFYHFKCLENVFTFCILLCDIKTEKNGDWSDKEWQTTFLTNGGDDSSSKEKWGTEVPEAHLIGWISWWVHTSSDCWNHLLEWKMENRNKC